MFTWSDAMKRFCMLLLAAGAIALTTAGCGSGEGVAVLGPEERFARAKALYDKGDFLEAINEFTVITLQYQGSAVAADAQFYMGESRFQREEFLLAAFEYSVLKRNYAASTRVADGQFKMALAYYRLSPKSALDQQYTRKAIDEFQSFVEYYPTHASVPEAEAHIQELNTRLAKKTFDTAQLYVTMQYYKAALLYFDAVIEKFHDTEFAPLAHLGKTEVYLTRKKYREASEEIGRFLAKYPNSVLRARGDALKQEVDERLRDAPAATPEPLATPRAPLSSAAGER
jgi:outer membrane protein assembly factor BamD